MNELSIPALLDSLIQQAIYERASDIHVEVVPQGVRVRFRVDGLLYDKKMLESAVTLPLIARIKVLAKLDVAQSRLPQDGKISFVYNNRPIDIRISTFPTLLGEKVVLRILDRERLFISFDELGLSESMQNTIVQSLRAHSGFFLVCGPTGSGKTTTLYALIDRLNTEHTHIVTLEDPVEYTIESITQSQVNPLIGFTFAAGMRALLRQDPDIALIGEIRDKETAGIAIEAALTGHLVLSTVHTNNAISVVMRLIDMEIEPFLIAAALTAVLAQRLVRKICTHCKAQYVPSEQERSVLQRMGYTPDYLYHGIGCDACMKTGYCGRIGIFELLIINDALRELIVHKAGTEKFVHAARVSGMRSLHEDAVHKLKNGVTTLSEIMRIVL